MIELTDLPAMVDGFPLSVNTVVYVGLCVPAQSARTSPAIVFGMMLAGAYKVAQPAIIGTFEYSYLVFLGGLGCLFFDIALNSATVAGAVMIVVAGAMVLRSKVQTG